jgi:hypothetical protein
MDLTFDVYHPDDVSKYINGIFRLTSISATSVSFRAFSAANQLVAIINVTIYKNNSDNFSICADFTLPSVAKGEFYNVSLYEDSDFACSLLNLSNYPFFVTSKDRFEIVGGSKIEIVEFIIKIVNFSTIYYTMKAFL